MAKGKSKQYRALVNLYHRDGTLLCEAGHLTSQIPPKSVKWLLDQGRIETVGRDKAEED